MCSKTRFILMSSRDSHESSCLTRTMFLHPGLLTATEEESENLEEESETAEQEASFPTQAEGQLTEVRLVLL